MYSSRNRKARDSDSAFGHALARIKERSFPVDAQLNYILYMLVSMARISRLSSCKRFTSFMKRLESLARITLK